MIYFPGNLDQCIEFTNRKRMSSIKQDGKANIDDRAAVKIVRKGLLINGCTHQNDLQISSGSNQIPDQDHQEIVVYISLVNLVEHQMRNVVEERVGLNHPQKDPCGAENNTSIRTGKY